MGNEHSEMEVSDPTFLIKRFSWIFRNTLLQKNSYLRNSSDLSAEDSESEAVQNSKRTEKHHGMEE